MNPQSRLRRILLLAGLGVLLFILFIWIINFFGTRSQGTLVIATPKAPQNGRVNITVKPLEGEAISLTVPTDSTRSIRIKAGNVRVDSQLGDIKSIDVVTIHSGKTTNLTAPAGQQMATQQIGANAVYCPVATKKALYSYNCRGEGAIIRHGTSSGSGNAYMFGAALFTNTQRLGGGLLGSRSSDRGNLVFINLDKSRISVLPLPTEQKKYLQAERPQIVPQNGGSGPGFVLVFGSANKAFLYKNIQDTKPVELTIGQNIQQNDSKRSLSFTFNQDRVAIYAGIAGHSDEGEPGEETSGGESIDKNMPCYIFEYNLDGTLVSTTTIPSFVGSQNIYKLPNNFYAAERDDSFTFYFKNGVQAEEVYAVDDIASWAISGGRTFVQAGGTVFEFIPQADGAFSLHSRFSNSAMTASELHDSARGLLFTAFAGTGAGAPLNVYQLLDKKQTENTPQLPPILQYSNFEAFLDYGLSQEQYEIIKNNVALLAQKVKPQAKTATATTITPQDRSTASNQPFVTTFGIAFDDAGVTIHGRAEYEGLASLRVYFYDAKTRKLVFDSK